MSSRPTIALVTCATLPELDPDDRLLIEPLRAAGVAAVPAVWDDATVDWAGFDLVVIRNTWDYPARRTEFLNWARLVPKLRNPADVIAWNTDKRYLAQLAVAGVPIVPTTWLDPARCSAVARAWPTRAQAVSRCRLARCRGVRAA